MQVCFLMERLPLLLLLIILLIDDQIHELTDNEQIEILFIKIVMVAFLPPFHH